MQRFAARLRTTESNCCAEHGGALDDSKGRSAVDGLDDGCDVVVCAEPAFALISYVARKVSGLGTHMKPAAPPKTVMSCDHWRIQTPTLPPR